MNGFINNFFQSSDSLGIRLPTYIVDLNTIEKNISNLTNICDTKNSKFLMSEKARVKEAGLLLKPDGFDVSNCNELRHALKISQSSSIISISGPMTNIYSEMETVFKLSEQYGEQYFYLYVESARGLEHLHRLLKLYKSGKNLTFGLRLEWTFTHDKASTRFGLTKNDLDKIPDFTLFRAIQVHSADSNKEVKSYRKVANYISNIIDKKSLYHIEVLNIGGSLPNGGVDMVSQVLTLTRNEIGNKIQIHLEPGEYYYRKSIYYISEINNVVEKKFFHQATINGSKENHLKWSKPNLIGIMNFEYNWGEKPTIFFGTTCFEGDCLGAYKGFKTSNLPQQHKSIAIFESISSYSIVWNTMFNGIDKCNIYEVRI